MAADAMEGRTYAKKAEGTPKNAYNRAMADWFHAPEILDVDLSAWDGQAGQSIRIQAQDNVLVKQVTVVIADEAGVLLEEGRAAPADKLWWEYKTTAAASGNPKVVIAAQDLPGHIAQATKEGKAK